jgi:hypothetical protein
MPAKISSIAPTNSGRIDGPGGGVFFIVPRTRMRGVGFLAIIIFRAAQMFYVVILAQSKDF